MHKAFGAGSLFGAGLLLALWQLPRDRPSYMLFALGGIVAFFGLLALSDAEAGK